jgi:hypothetical protein
VLRLGDIKNGEKVWVLREIRETGLLLANNSSFLTIDHTDDSGKNFLSSLGKTVNIYLEAERPFF